MVFTIFDEIASNITRNFDLIAFLFLIPILIIFIGAKIRKSNKLPENSISDWLLFLMTFDLAAFSDNFSIAQFICKPFYEFHVPIFLLLFLVELLILLYVIPLEKNLIYSHFSKLITSNGDIVPKIFENHETSGISLFVKRIFWWFLVYFFFVFTIYMFVAK